MTPTPDLALIGGVVADVRAGVLHRAAVGIAGSRIIAVGRDDEIAPAARQVLDVSGRVLVPGYVEPHTHAILANPLELGLAMLARGTTAAAVDALPLMLLARPDRLPGLLEALADALPIRLRWLIRLHPQSFAHEERFSLETLRPLWRLPSAAAVGEVTRWRDVQDGDPDLLAKIRAAAADGRRIEGHAAGASPERLRALAAAGFTSCHEAVTAQEVVNRLDAGLYAMLRHSSIRPDLPALLAAVTPDRLASSRLMLTVDGPTPAFLDARGYLDHLLAIAMRSGIPPLSAYRMATLNPAEYFGMADLGEIAPGKRADLNVLTDLGEPTPSLVFADGQLVAQHGRVTISAPQIPWEAAFDTGPLPRLAAEAFAPPASPVAFRLTNDVLTEPVSTDPPPPDALQVVLVDRRGRWATQALLSDFVDRLGGLATTISSGFDIIVAGQDPADMAQALDRLADLGGGLVVIDGGRETFALPLDLGGAFSSQPFAAVAEANRRFNALMRDRGYRFADPVFSLLFLTFDSLPWVRLTARGVWDVRARRVLAPPVRL